MSYEHSQARLAGAGRQSVASAARARVTLSRFATETYLSRAILALALVSGAGLRLWHINQLGFNTDEAVYVGQAAAIAGEKSLVSFFPMFRAHPLLFQFILALGVPSVGLDNVDLFARLVAAAMGILTVIIVYQTGVTLYRPRTGAIAALFMALMPYHVIVTRQALLDGPMVLFATLTLFCMARFGATHRPAWLYAASASMGLTFLSKETAILLVGGIYIYLAISPETRVRFRDLVISTVVLGSIMIVYPLVPMLAGGGGGEKAGNYLVWQLFRRPNHSWLFYALTVPQAIGLLLVAAAVAGIVWRRRQVTWREKLLISWIIVPCVFFELWPVKGFQYLLPIAPPLALLAAWAIDGRTAPAGDDPGPAPLRQRLALALSRGRGQAAAAWLWRSLAWHGRRLPPRWAGLLARERAALARPLLGEGVRLLGVAAVALSLLWPTFSLIHSSSSSSFLAGTGGVAGGREAGQWVRENTPEGATFLALGPSMANIIQFYGRRKAYGLSVSTNPLHRNPSYDPLRNPDFSLRAGDLQYIVWDSYSANRSPFFAASMERFIKRYHGRAVHTQAVTVRSSDGQSVVEPVIIIYEVSQ